MCYFPPKFLLFVQENVLSSMRFQRQESAEEEAKIGDTCSRIEFRTIHGGHTKGDVIWFRNKRKCCGIGGIVFIVDAVPAANKEPPFSATELIITNLPTYLVELKRKFGGNVISGWREGGRRWCGWMPA